MERKIKKLAARWKWFLLLSISGLIVLLFCPGYDMTGLALLGVSALFPVYHGISLLYPHHRSLSKGLHMALTLFLAVFFAAVAITWGIIAHSARGTEEPESDYLVVLGAAVHGKVPSRSLRERLDATKDYLTAHPDAVAIVSGGQGSGEEITEARCMYDYLTSHGIDPDRVWMESEATNTLENLRFSLDLIEENHGSRPDRIAIVSSEYHLHRAGIFAGWLNLEAELVPARTEIFLLRWNYCLREVFAVWYYSLFGGR